MPNHHGSILVGDSERARLIAKTILVVLAFLALFSGSLVAAHRPFRPIPAGLILMTGCALLGAAFTTGTVRLACVGTLLIMILITVLWRAKR